jgi:hypothetical protein
MPFVAILVIVGLMTWLGFVTRRSNPGLERSRSAHPSSPENPSVHVLHLGEPND